MLFVLGEQASVANQFMSELRDQQIQLDRPRFRKNLQRLGAIMAYEVSKKLPMTTREVRSPLGKVSMELFQRQPVLITIMRAGLPYFAGFQNYFDQAECGFVGAFRKDGNTTVTIQLDYLATPSIADKDVLLIDPMLATGRSVVDTIHQLLHQGTPRHVHFASVLASPEGIRYLEKNVSLPHSIWTFSVDKMLNPQFFIVPGLGDAGDLSFGNKMGMKNG